MKTLKYIIVAFALLAAPAAQAWNAKSSRSIAELATLHLTPEAKSQVEAILGGSLSKNTSWLARLRKEGQAQHTAQWQSVTVARNLRSMTSDENDAVVQIERATAILRDRANQSDSLVKASLRTVIHLVSEMHEISNIHIEGVPASLQNFNIKLSNGRQGKAHKLSNYTWKKLWSGFWIGRHSGFSPALYGLELDICYGKYKDALSKGNPRVWAVDMARQSIVLYRWAKPDCVLDFELLNDLEPMQDVCLARAGFRLAALLNDIFK